MGVSRREAIVGIVLAWTFAPSAARALLPAKQPEILKLDVADVGGFDPIVRRDTEGRISRHNLSMRTTDPVTERMIGTLEGIRRLTLAELSVRWESPSGPQSLTMCDAYLLEFSYVSLFQQGRGLNFDEFAIAVESTHGSLRRSEAKQTLVADYQITPRGVQWKRYSA